jgi:hypothetical protein
MAAAFRIDSDSDDDEIPRDGFENMNNNVINEVHERPSLERFQDVMRKNGIPDESSKLLYEFSHLVDGVSVTLADTLYQEAGEGVVPEIFIPKLKRTNHVLYQNNFENNIENHIEDDEDEENLQDIADRSETEEENEFIQTLEDTGIHLIDLIENSEFLKLLIPKLKEIQKNNKIQERLRLLKWRKASKIEKERRNHHDDEKGGSAEGSTSGKRSRRTQRQQQKTQRQRQRKQKKRTHKQSREK